MDNHWILADKTLSSIAISSNPNNEPVSIHGSSSQLKCIGIGTDAAVFQSSNVPVYAFKKFADDKIHKMTEEKKVYVQIGDSPYFSSCYGSKDDYLVLDFEEGITLYDCLLRGIPIPKQVIDDVEEAREHVLKQGLNPRDIHLKNILLQHGRAKIIDVSEYTQPGNDFRWEHLKKAYDRFYPMIEGKPVPLGLIKTIQQWYHQRSDHSDLYKEVSDRSSKLLASFLK